MNKIQALKHEAICCDREYLVHLEDRRRRSYEEFLACDREFRKELEILQKKERDFYAISAKTAS